MDDSKQNRGSKKKKERHEEYVQIKALDKEGLTKRTRWLSFAKSVNVAALEYDMRFFFVF
jgi:hypothetical protein